MTRLTWNIILGGWAILIGGLLVVVPVAGVGALLILVVMLYGLALCWLGSGHRQPTTTHNTPRPGEE